VVAVVGPVLPHFLDLLAVAVLVAWLWEMLH
jgi:hypothetical protein